jgi:nitroreductase
VILDCLRVAMQAPKVSNAQDWRWPMITDAGKRATESDPQARRVYRSALSCFLAKY